MNIKGIHANIKLKDEFEEINCITLEITTVPRIIIDKVTNSTCNSSQLNEELKEILENIIFDQIKNSSLIVDNENTRCLTHIPKKIMEFLNTEACRCM